MLVEVTVGLLVLVGAFQERSSLKQGAGRRCEECGHLHVVNVIVSLVPWGVVDEKGNASRAKNSLHI